MDYGIVSYKKDTMDAALIRSRRETLVLLDVIGENLESAYAPLTSFLCRTRPPVKTLASTMPVSTRRL